MSSANESLRLRELLKELTAFIRESPRHADLEDERCDDDPACEACAENIALLDLIKRCEAA